MVSVPHVAPCSLAFDTVLRHLNDFNHAQPRPVSFLLLLPASLLAPPTHDLPSSARSGLVRSRSLNARHASLTCFCRLLDTSSSAVMPYGELPRPSFLSFHQTHLLHLPSSSPTPPNRYVFYILCPPLTTPLPSLRPRPDPRPRTRLKEPIHSPAAPQPSPPPPPKSLFHHPKTHQYHASLSWVL